MRTTSEEVINIMTTGLSGAGVYTKNNDKGEWTTVFQVEDFTILQVTKEEVL